MDRSYIEFIFEHFQENRQMLFLMGPRQVGKTTISELLANEWGDAALFNWDDNEDRELILEGPRAVAAAAEIDFADELLPIVIFDEIHKYPHWKDFLKGFFDLYHNSTAILVTGSAQLDFFRKSGDSLMGRYFTCRVHPLSVAELVHKQRAAEELVDPKKIGKSQLENLLTFGGFPEPFLRANQRFYRRWHSLRSKQLFGDEIRDLTLVQNIELIETLASFIKNQVGQLSTYTSFSKKLKKSVPTVQSWLKVLKGLYYCFEVRPWSSNVARSLIKEPKYYLWDWSLCEERGALLENFVASHLLKAVHFWTDCGLGEYDLFYLRDKSKREVDFLVSRDGKPWFLVEVKASSHKPISESLRYFQEHLEVGYAFQLCFDSPYVDSDCFKRKGVWKVAATTLLSQLV